ncbi:hypothetical protein HQ571_02975 [Candidatus Kuenenbacteria bacterium]|nr:hypothetical protein [Candidatus Kuenenbacteria bacterium]
MSVENWNQTPSSNEEEQNKELIGRARGLERDFHEMLKRNNGKYPSSDDMGRFPAEDSDAIHELDNFFEFDCDNIPSLDVGDGGNNHVDELKKLSDELWLYREVEANYDVDEKEVSFISKEKAMELIRSRIEERKKRIKGLEDENQEAEKVLNE